MKNVEDIYPLSPMQQGMLFHTLLDPHAGDYLTQLTGTIEGKTTLAAFRSAWREVIQRHAVLRTGFVWETLDQPLQVVHQNVDLPCTQHDWQDRSNWESDFNHFLIEDRAAGFDLVAAPLMRLTIFEVAEEVYRFVWTHHHLLLDGWSLPLVMKELFSFADASCNGHRLQFATPRPYRDYIGWLAARDESAAEHYWRNALSGFSAPTPLGAISAARDQERRSRAHGELRWTLAPTITAALSAVARGNRLTLNSLIQGAWALLLHHHSGEQDIVFGATVSGRPADLNGVESMVGLFINTQPVRVKVQSEMPVVPWLESIQAQQTQARQFEYCRLTSVHGWSAVPRSMPLFESIVIFENYPSDALGASNQTLGVRDIGVVETTSYPLALIAAPGQDFELRLNYDLSRFEPKTIERMADHLTVLLEGIAVDAYRRVSELPIMSQAEERLVVHDWNHTEVPYPNHRCLDALFLDQVQRTPDAVALSFDRQSLTYAELNERANQIAAALQSRGAGPEVLVGIALDRSLEMIASILGVLKAGAAWLPIAVDQPPQRIAFLLNEARPRVVVSNGYSRTRLPQMSHSCEMLNLDDLDLEKTSDPQIGKVSTLPTNLAYMIYTSGSTGRPKGVMVEHRGVVNLAFAQAKLFKVNAGTRVLQFAAPTFDAAVSEIFVTLLNGGTLVLARREQLIGPDLSRLLGEAAINVVTLPPSVLATMPETELPELHTLVVAGEACSPDLVKRWSAGRRMVNAYGPTEATVCATGGECDGRGSITIGRPIDNVSIYIVDANLRPAPIGVPGELLIGGAGVARGYFERPQLTDERFILNPFVQQPGARLYRTGDRARYLADGRIEYLGRTDRQVKIRGFRIEPGEVEAALTEVESVREAIVIDHESSPGHRSLVAYVTARNNALLVGRELRKALQERLPQYMVPSSFVVLDELPLTAHGKIDRSALPAPHLTNLKLEKSKVAPRSAVEQVVANIWQQVLNGEPVSIHENFFELGGHSLLAMQVASRVREDLGIDLPIASVFSFPTVAGLSECVLRDPIHRRVVERTAQLVLSTANLSDDELEAFVASEPAAAELTA